MSTIAVSNDGAKIVETNFFESEYAKSGKPFCSCNAGCIRVLVPSLQRGMIEEVRSAKYVILSRGPWPEMRLPDAVEMLFEDGSGSPFVLHLSPQSFDLLPGEPPPGREWTFHCGSRVRPRY